MTIVKDWRPDNRRLYKLVTNTVLGNRARPRVEEKEVSTVKEC